MKLESQVCNLELAKKFKELGVKEESLWYWSIGKDAHIVRGRLPRKCDREYVSAFTVAELLNISPDDITYFKCTLKGSTIYNAHQGFDKHIEADTMADAIAKMLIWLIENKMMEVWSEH